MKTPSAISRRIESSIVSAQKNNFEESLLHFFPAMDATATRRYPKLNVGARNRKLLEDQQEIITLIATNNYLNISCSGITFSEAIYKFARNPMVHEGELDKRISFDNLKGLTIGEKWNLPPSYILGLIVGVIVAIENKNELIDNDLGCILWRTKYRFNQLWGKPELVHTAIQNFVIP